jgi:hypothetical protein
MPSAIAPQAADCDEVDGLEDAIDEWVDGLWPQLKQQLSARLPGGEQQVHAHQSESWRSA